MLESPELDETRLTAMLDLAKERSRALSQRHRRRRAATGAAALAVTLAIAGAIVIGPTGGAPTRHQATSSVPTKTLTPAWRLVGDVTQASWQEHPPLSGSQPQYSLVCPTATTCYMLEGPGSQPQAPPSSIEVTGDGGASWQQLALPTGTQTTTSLDCIDASTFVLGAFDSAGNAVLLTTDDAGQTWTSQPGPSQLTPSFQFFDISCTTATACVAIGGVSPADQSSEVYYSLATNDGGQSWADSEFAAGFVPSSIECFSAGGGCMAAGFEQPTTPSADTGVQGAAMYSTDGGSTWATAAVPDGLGPINTVSCGQDGTCNAVTFGGKESSTEASQTLVTTDGGRTWTATAASGLPASMLQGLSCPTSSYCWASGILLPTDSGGSPTTPFDLADLQGVLAMTTDGGQTWEPAQLPADLTQSVITSVSCPTSTNCLALAWQEAKSQPAQFVLLSYTS